MNNLQVRAMIAGLFFGLWPLFMNRSGIRTDLAPVAFSIFALLFVLPTSIGADWTQLLRASWPMLLLAGLTSAVGTYEFNSMLAVANPSRVGLLFVLMIVIQIMVPATYQAVMDGLNPSKVAGFILAIAAAFLLNW